MRKSFAINGPPSASGSASGASVEMLLREASPVLEAFGNAKTIRNDNSSRFGKYVAVQYDADNIIVGATSETYALFIPHPATPHVPHLHAAPSHRTFTPHLTSTAGATSESRARTAALPHQPSDPRPPCLARCRTWQLLARALARGRSERRRA
jgi:hypothetical protein